MRPAKPNTQTMKSNEAKKILMTNLAFWLVGALMNPVLRMLPTSTGQPPKIYDVLVPLFFVGLAMGSTYLMRIAIGKTRDD